MRTICSPSSRAPRVARPEVRPLRAKKQVAKRGLLVARASGWRENDLKAELSSLQQEAADVEAQARAQQAKRNDLLEAVRGMERLALNCLNDGQDQRARVILEEKAAAQAKLESLEGRVRDLLSLEVKLSEAMQAKRAQLSSPGYDLPRGDFQDNSIGVRLVMGEDGKPRFERTGTIGGMPPAEPPQQPRDRSYNVSPPRPSYEAPWDYGTASPPSTSYSARQGRDLDSSFRDMDLDNLLNASDRRLDEKFLELERQQLERSLRASDPSAFPSNPLPPRSPSSNMDNPLPPSSPQYPPTLHPRFTPSQRPPSPWDTPPPAAGGSQPRQGSQEIPPVSQMQTQHGGSGAGEGRYEGRSKSQPPVVAEWWTMGQNSLMDGALAPLLKEIDSDVPDAATALAAVTNSRIRGQDPAPRKLLALIQLSLQTPQQHGSGPHWGVQQVRGAQQMPANIKLAIFGATLQLAIEDLLTGESKILTRNEVRRSGEARALLVALASAIDLRSSEASEFSVKVICRAMRRCIVNAHVAVRQAYQGDDSAMTRAETDLQALHNVLRTLPIALPLAMNHVAAVEATEQLRAIVKADDARRLDKLYRLVCNEDTSSAALRAILEPLFMDI